MITLGDMLYYYPRRYDDYSQLKPIKELFYGEQVTVIGTIQSVHTRPIRGGKASIIEVILSDGTGGLRLSYFNQPWLANRFKQGDALSVSGKVAQYVGRLIMKSPDWESVEVENLHSYDSKAFLRYVNTTSSFKATPTISRAHRELSKDVGATAGNEQVHRDDGRGAVVLFGMPKEGLGEAGMSIIRMRAGGGIWG